MKPNASRRTWLAGAFAAVAGLAWTARVRAATSIQQRPVSGFTAIAWHGAGDLEIQQTGRERLSIEADPAVLAKVVAEVRQKRLWIGFGPGRLESSEPIRFRVEVKSLESFEGQGSGTVRLGPLTAKALSVHLGASDRLELVTLDARTLDVRMAGAGDVTVGGGQVERQRIVIAGAGVYSAHRLDCRHADVSIDGSGAVHLAASERLVAHIGGSGDVVYHGDPSVSATVNGAGHVSKAEHTP